MNRYRPFGRTPAVSVQPALVFGEDALGASVADSLQAIYGADLAGVGGPPGDAKFATTGLGDPQGDFRGDLGPIQGRGGPTHLRTNAGRPYLMPPPAFPTTRGHLDIQDLMGQLGI